MKIKSIDIKGNPDDLTFWEDFEGKYPLPDIAKNEFANRYNVRLSLLQIDLMVDNFSMKFIFEEGYLFDHASSPKIFNWFIDHDAKWVTIAAYVHDAIFHHQKFEVDFAAELFYKIMRYSIKYSKMNWFQKIRCYIRARAMRIAVKTFLAHKSFAMTTDIDRYNCRNSNIQVGL